MILRHRTGKAEGVRVEDEMEVAVFWDLSPRQRSAGVSVSLDGGCCHPLSPTEFRWPYHLKLMTRLIFAVGAQKQSSRPTLAPRLRTAEVVSVYSKFWSA